MKAFQKFFKRENKEMIEVQSLAVVEHTELCQMVINFQTGLREASHQITIHEAAIKQLKTEVSNANDQVLLYKSLSEELQNHCNSVSTEIDSYKTLLESKSLEVQYFKEKLSQLEADLENSEAVVRKLKERLEKSEWDKEVSDAAVNAARGREQLALKRAEDAEGCFWQRNEEYESVVKEKELSIAKVRDCEEREKRLQDEANENLSKIEALENRLHAMESEVERIKACSISEISMKDAEITLAIAELKNQSTMQLEDYRSSIHHSEMLVEKLSAELKILQTSLNKALDLKSEYNVKHFDSIEEEFSSQCKKRSSLTLAPVSPKSAPQLETKALQEFKVQIDSVYKALMELMLSAHTTREQGKGLEYHVKSEAFSAFEKELNKVVMNAHEAAENPSYLDSGKGSIGRMSTWAPSKFFSFKPSGSKSSLPTTPENKHASFNGFF